MKAFLLIFFLGLFLKANGQIDNTTGFSTPIPAIEKTEGLNSPLLSPENNRSLTRNKSLMGRTEENKPLAEEKKYFDMSTDNGLKTRKFDYKPSWLTKDKELNEEYFKGQNLGSFQTSGKFIEILCRDHQYVDGDRVKLIVNGYTLIHNINLREDYQRFALDVKEGINTIEFEALNQGTSGPNTAHFKVYNEKGELLTDNEWNLATGVKATLVIIREE